MLTELFLRVLLGDFQVRLGIIKRIKGQEGIDSEYR